MDWIQIWPCPLLTTGPQASDLTSDPRSSSAKWAHNSIYSQGHVESGGKAGPDAAVGLRESLLGRRNSGCKGKRSEEALVLSGSFSVAEEREG